MPVVPVGGCAIVGVIAGSPLTNWEIFAPGGGTPIAIMYGPNGWSVSEDASNNLTVCSPVTATPGTGYLVQYTYFGSGGGTFSFDVVDLPVIISVSPSGSVSPGEHLSVTVRNWDNTTQILIGGNISMMVVSTSLSGSDKVADNKTNNGWMVSQDSRYGPVTIRPPKVARGIYTINAYDWFSSDNRFKVQ